MKKQELILEITKYILPYYRWATGTTCVDSNSLSDFLGYLEKLAEEEDKMNKEIKIT